MSSVRWVADLRELDGLRRWYREQPKLLRMATGRLLNDFAFGVRREAIHQIEKNMVVRNKRFVSGRIQVDKARIFRPISRQESSTGSIAIPGNTSGKGPFSGWVEQEFGDQTQRDRFSSLAGRGGDVGKQMRHIVRLKPKHDIVTMDTPGFRPTGGERNVAGFFEILKKRRENRIIRLRGTYYKRKRREFEVVQSTEKRQPKRVKWLWGGSLVYFRRVDIDRMYRRHINRIITGPRKR